MVATISELVTGKLLYRCKWDNTANRPQAISQPKNHETQYQSKQPALFDPRWLRDPVEGNPPPSRPLKRPLRSWSKGGFLDFV